MFALFFPKVLQLCGMLLFISLIFTFYQRQLLYKLNDSQNKREQYSQMLHKLRSELDLCNELSKDLSRKRHTITQFQFKPTDLSCGNAPFYTDHPLINSILQYEVSKFEQYSVNFKVDCETCTEKNWTLNETDTLHLLCNLLDNAFESAEGRDDPFVEIQFSYCEPAKRYRILQRNSKASDSHPILSGFATTKKGEDSHISHGHGVEIIQEIVEEYEGRIEFHDYDTFFEINIII